MPLAPFDGRVLDPKPQQRTSTVGVARFESATQCAAVTTTLGAMREQPQYRKLLL